MDPRRLDHIRPGLREGDTDISIAQRFGDAAVDLIGI
jgi:hypothetical protein